MLRILILTCLLFEASAAHISAYGNTTAAFGGDAHYRCVMDEPEGVQQVTWQRLFGDSSIENLATYSKRFGIQINSPYHGKVTLTEPSLSSTSITLKNVTWKDESCYICSFNVYPNGSTRKQTCITVQGISEVYTQSSTTIKGDEKKDRDVVFSCSATGKPAPTIEWDFSTTATKLSQTQTTTVKNSDHTFTSSCNITLKIPPRWTGHVDCVLNRGMVGERQERIPLPVDMENNDTTEGNEAEKVTTKSSSWIAVVILMLICISCIVVAVLMRQKWIKAKRRNLDVTQEEGLAFEQT